LAGIERVYLQGPHPSQFPNIKVEGSGSRKTSGFRKTSRYLIILDDSVGVPMAVSQVFDDLDQVNAYIARYLTNRDYQVVSTTEGDVQAQKQATEEDLTGPIPKGGEAIQSIMTNLLAHPNVETVTRQSDDSLLVKRLDGSEANLATIGDVKGFTGSNKLAQPGRSMTDYLNPMTYDNPAGGPPIPAGQSRGGPADHRPKNAPPPASPPSSTPPPVQEPSANPPSEAPPVSKGKDQELSTSTAMNEHTTMLASVRDMLLGFMVGMGNNRGTNGDGGRWTR
jgi:hypothetical protein